MITVKAKFCIFIIIRSLLVASDRKPDSNCLVLFKRRGLLAHMNEM